VIEGRPTGPRDQHADQGALLRRRHPLHRHDPAQGQMQFV